MRQYPYRIAKPTEVRSPSRYLIWLGLQQLPSLAGGVFFGSLWLLIQALMPLVLGWAIDFGITAKNWNVLLLSTAGMVLLGALLRAISMRELVNTAASDAIRIG